MAFLVNFPLTDKLIDKYVNFLVKNLDYEYVEGKETCYELLETILSKFPIELIH